MLINVPVAGTSGVSKVARGVFREMTIASSKHILPHQQKYF